MVDFVTKAVLAAPKLKEKMLDSDFESSEEEAGPSNQFYYKYEYDLDDACQFDKPWQVYGDSDSD